MGQKRWIAGLSTLGLTVGTVLVAPTAHAVDPANPVMINEVYGGGGNSGATYKSDFIELFNSGDVAVDLSSWSVQYASAAGSTWTQRTNLTGSIAPGAYYLIKQADGAGGSTDLPTPDVVGTIAMSGTAGRVALVNNQTNLTCGTACANTNAVVDYVGWGTAVDFAGSAPAPGTSNGTSVSRNAEHANSGDNAADFASGAPSPTSGAGDGGGDPGPVDPVEATIAQVQGTGDTSPLVGKTVITKGVVTAAYPTGGFNGYYIQTPGTGGAVDPVYHTASDAVFVYSPATVSTVTPGDYVQVTGAVSEFGGLTEITVADAASLTVLTDQVAAPIPATTATLPATDAQRESLEGMLYQPTGPFTVTNTYGTNQYGELGLAAGDQPLLQWTEVSRPGTPEAAAVIADNNARGIVMDDGASTNFLSAAASSQTPPYISLTNPVRVGAKATFSSPVIFTEGGSPTSPTYRFQPLAQVTTDAAAYPLSWNNTRTDAPNAEAIGGDFQVASFNVLNYFTTLGDSVAGCTSYNDRDGNPIAVNSCPGNGPRGAWNSASLQRQQDKIVAAINSSGADLVGLMEIENSTVVSGKPDAALATLVDALNADAGAGTWDYVRSSAELPDVSLMDVITSAIIYRPAVVTPVGPARALGTQSADDQAFGNAREPIAQEFEPTGGGTRFLFGVNHFKSKGSAGPWPGDADTGDGQGASNESRVRQATALRDWIGSLVDVATEPVLMVGDYNSYSQEDPLQVLYDAGYVDAEHQFDVGKYSYSFSGFSGSLDHVLMNKAAVEMATGADIWNINSGESVALQYSRYNYHGTLFYQPNQFAASDHDPVIVGLSAGAAATTVTLSASSATQIYGAKQPSQLTATVSGKGDLSGRVVFRNGDKVIGKATVSAEGIAITAADRWLPVGAASITAEYVPASGDSITSAPFTLTVTPAPTTLDIKLASTPKGTRVTVWVRVKDSLAKPSGRVAIRTSNAAPSVPVSGNAPVKVIVGPSTTSATVEFVPADSTLLPAHQQVNFR